MCMRCLPSKILIRVFSLIAVLFITTSALFSQQLRVTGKVTSSTDETPITGATVQVKKTGTTAITDANGSYTISARCQRRVGSNNKVRKSVGNPCLFYKQRRGVRCGHTTRYFACLRKCSIAYRRTGQSVSYTHLTLPTKRIV